MSFPSASKTTTIKEIEKLKEELDSYVEREEALEEELLVARQESLLKDEHLEESLRQLDHLKVEIEVSGDEGAEADSQLTVLHSQRAELVRRVRKLLDVNGQLRSTSTTLRHRIDRKEKRIETLQQQVSVAKHECRMSENMRQQELVEWKNRFRILQHQLQDCQRLIRKRSTRNETSRLQQRLDELEDENSTLQKQQESQKYSWSHERSLLKRNITSLEDKVADLEHRLRIGKTDGGLLVKAVGRIDTRGIDDATADTAHDMTMDHFSVVSSIIGTPKRTSTSPTTDDVLITPPSREASLTQSSQPSRQGSLASGNAMAVAAMKERLQQVENSLKQAEARELAQREEILELRQIAETSKVEKKFAQERVELVQSYLDISLANQPSKDKELRNELLSNMAKLEERHGSENLQRGQSLRLQQQLLKEKNGLSVRQKARIERVRDLDRSFVLSESSIALDESLSGSASCLRGIAEDTPPSDLLNKSDSSMRALPRAKTRGLAKESGTSLEKIQDPPQLLRSLPSAEAQCIADDLYDKSSDEKRLLENRVALLDKRCVQLSSENKKLMELSSKRNGEILVLQRKLAVTTTNCEESSAKVHTLTEEISKIQDHTSAVRVENAELQRILEEKTTTFRKTKEHLQNQLDTTAKETAEFVELHTNLEVERLTTIERLKSENNNYSEKVQSLSTELEAKTSEIIEQKNHQSLQSTSILQKDELIAKLEAERARLLGDVSAMSGELASSVRALSKEQESLRDATQEVLRTREDLRVSNKSLQELRRENASLKSVSDMNSTLKRQLDESISACKSLEVEISGLREQLIGQKAQLEETKEIIGGKDELIRKQASQIIELRSSVADLEARNHDDRKKDEEKFSRACTQLNEFEEVVNQLQDEIISVEKERDDLLAQVTQQQQRLEGALSQFNEMEDLMLGAEKKIGEHERKEICLEDELHAARVECAAALEKGNDLDEQLRMLNMEKDVLEQKLEELQDAECGFTHRLEDMQEALFVSERDRKSAELASADLQKEIVAKNGELDVIRSENEHLKACIQSQAGELEAMALRHTERVEVLSVHKDSLEHQLHSIRLEHSSTLEKCASVEQKLATTMEEKMASERKLIEDLKDAKSTFIHAEESFKQKIASTQEKADAMESRGTILNTDLIRLQCEHELLRVEKENLEKSVVGLQKELKHANEEITDAQKHMEAAAAHSIEKTRVLTFQSKELEDSLKALQSDYKLLSSERDSYRERADDVQHQADLAETKCAKLQRELESREAEFLEANSHSASRLKILEDEITKLVAQLELVNAEKGAVANKLAGAQSDVSETRKTVSNLKAEHQGYILRSEDRITSLTSKAEGLEKELHVLREQCIALTEEKDCLQKHLAKLKNAEVESAQKVAEVERTLSIAISRNDLLNGELSKLHSALDRVNQANQYHQEKLTHTEIEAKKSAELLDEATTMLGEALEEKSALEMKLDMVPEHIAIDDSMSFRSAETTRAERG